MISSEALGRSIGAMLLLFGALMFFLACGLIKDAFAPPYVQLDDADSALLAIGMGFLCCYPLWRFLNPEASYLANDVFLFSTKNKRKERIRILHIKSYTETEHQSRKGPYKLLTLLTADKAIRIRSDKELGYEHIKKLTTAGKPKSTGHPVSNANGLALPRYQTWMLAAGLILLVAFWLQRQTKPTDQAAPSLSEMPITIVHVERKTSGSRHRHRNRFLELKVQEWPDFSFQIRGDVYKRYRAVVPQYKMEEGYKMVLHLSAHDMDGKLLQARALPFDERHFEYERIDVYGLKDAQKTYIDPEIAFKDQWTRNRAGATIFLLYTTAICLLIVGLITFLNARTQSTSA